MAIKVSYIAKESVNNLRRNLLMTLAALLTIVISISLAGAALLANSAIKNATSVYEKGFDVTVFMDPDANPTQVEAVRKELETRPEVDKVRYVDKPSSFAEIKKMFRNRPEYLEGFPTVNDAPEQFRVRPKDASQIDQIGRIFEKRPGVYSVSDFNGIKKVLAITGKIQYVILAIAFALAISAIVLILNTIRMAIFARRREVAVMKLVGATNAFIRLPFMVEGMLQGVVGAGIGFGLLALLTKAAQDSLRTSKDVLFRALSVSTSELMGTGVLMIIVGAIVGAVGSAIAVSRFLDV